MNDDNGSADDNDSDDSDDYESYFNKLYEKLNNKTSDDDYYKEFNDEEELEKLEILDERFKILNNKISDDNDHCKKIYNEEVKVKERPNKTLEKVIKESKNLLKAIKKYDEKKA